MTHYHQAITSSKELSWSFTPEIGDMFSKHPAEYFKSCRLLYCNVLNGIIALKALPLLTNPMNAGWCICRGKVIKIISSAHSHHLLCNPFGRWLKKWFPNTKTMGMQAILENKTLNWKQITLLFIKRISTSTKYKYFHKYMNVHFSRLPHVIQKLKDWRQVTIKFITRICLLNGWKKQGKSVKNKKTCDRNLLTKYFCKILHHQTNIKANKNKGSKNCTMHKHELRPKQKIIILQLR